MFTCLHELNINRKYRVLMYNSQNGHTSKKITVVLMDLIINLHSSVELLINITGMVVAKRPGTVQTVTLS